MSRGVYLLRFEGTSKVYIGQSLNIEKRFIEHLSSLRLNSASKKMQEAYNIYGTPVIEILAECEEHELIETEKEAISIFNSYKEGLNSMSSSGKPNVTIDDIPHQAKYVKEQIVRVLHLLVSDSLPGYPEISSITGVSVSAIAQISAGFTHTWLQIAYPIEYNKLALLRGTRANIKNSKRTTGATSSKYTTEQYISVLKALVSSTRSTQVKIAEQTGVDVNVVRDISSLRRHTWLETVCPVEYQILKHLKTKGK